MILAEASTDWGPVILGVCAPLLAAGVGVAIRVAFRQGQVDARLRNLEGWVQSIDEDVAYLTRSSTGRTPPSRRRRRPVADGPPPPPGRAPYDD